MAHPEYQLLIVGAVVLFGVVAVVAGVLGLRAARLPSQPAVGEPTAPAAPDLRAGLASTRSAFTGKIAELLRGRSELDRATLDRVEGILFGADLGVRTAETLLEAARGAGSPEAVRDALGSAALGLLSGVTGSDPAPHHPHVVLVVGVNGSGKTTSIGKLAWWHRREGRSVILGAVDTFRAAAIDQLAVWAERAGVEIVKGQPGGDPAAVAFDTVKAAVSRDLDVVLLDTAGRLQTDAALMAELEKIGRVVKKEIPDAPHEVVLVLDANTGQNAIRQAREFQRAVAVDRILLAKLDGTARGGVVLGIAQEVGIPVRWVGLGESIDDLADFDPEAFVDALFSSDDEDGAAA